jgi:hypothetical protein
MVCVKTNLSLVGVAHKGLGNTTGALLVTQSERSPVAYNWALAKWRGIEDGQEGQEENQGKN